MAETIQYGDPWPQTTGKVRTTVPPAAERLPASGAGELLRRLQERSQEVTEQIRHEVTAASSEVVRQVQRDAQDLRLRAEKLHEQQPIQAVGVAAGGAFVFGLILGLWRH